MNDSLRDLVASWWLIRDADTGSQVDALLEPLLAAGVLPDGHESFSAVLLGEQYHLGGAEDTRRMAEVLSITAADRVIDLACYVGGPARQLAHDYGCEVVGVDISPVHIAVAQALTSLCGLGNRVAFICASADAVPLRDASFTVAWSQCSFPSDLSWLTEMHRLLVPGGRIAFTGLIRRSNLSDPSHYSLDEMRERVADFGFRVTSTEDISEMDLEYGWYPAKQKLRQNNAHYCSLMGEEWVRKAFESLDADIAAWQSGSMGCGRIVAMKEVQ
jgi:SAM-dependent methyltransferase